MRRSLLLLIFIVIMFIITNMSHGTEKVKLEFISVNDPQASKILSKEEFRLITSAINKSNEINYSSWIKEQFKPIKKDDEQAWNDGLLGECNIYPYLEGGIGFSARGITCEIRSEQSISMTRPDTFNIYKMKLLSQQRAKIWEKEIPQMIKPVWPFFGDIGIIFISEEKGRYFLNVLNLESGESLVHEALPGDMAGIKIKEGAAIEYRNSHISFFYDNGACVIKGIGIMDNDPQNGMVYACTLDTKLKLLRVTDKEYAKISSIKRKKISARGARGVRLFVEALAKKDYDEAMILIENGLDVNREYDGEDGGLPLGYAAYDGNLEIVKILIERGADINKQDMLGDSALHLACYKGNETIVLYLLKKGANPNLRENRGKTPLFPAVNSLINIQHPGSSYSLVKSLLINGANPNLLDNNGDPVLKDAICNRDYNTTRYLLDYGADVHVRTNLNESNYDTLPPTTEICHNCTLLICLCAKWVTPEEKDVYSKIAQLLIEKGIDINVTNSCGKKAIDYAIKYKNEAVIKILKEASE